MSVFMSRQFQVVGIVRDSHIWEDKGSREPISETAVVELETFKTLEGLRDPDMDYGESADHNSFRGTVVFQGQRYALGATASSGEEYVLELRLPRSRPRDDLGLLLYVKKD